MPRLGISVQYVSGRALKRLIGFSDKPGRSRTVDGFSKLMISGMFAMQAKRKIVRSILYATSSRAATIPSSDSSAKPFRESLARVF